MGGAPGMEGKPGRNDSSIDSGSQNDHMNQLALYQKATS